METVKTITDAIGSGVIQGSCGVKIHSIRAAKRDGVFPASWYRVIKELCDADGLDCPVELFSFKEATKQAPEEAAA